MKAISILSLTAAMVLCSTTVTFAQTVGGTVSAGTGVTVEDGDVDLSLDTNADGTVDADETAAGVTAGGSADLSLDTNGDGTVDDEEAAAGEDMSLDADGDGTVSAEEAAAGVSNVTATECSSVDFGMMVSADGIAAIQAATTAQIVRLTACDDDQSSMMDSDVESAIFGNQAIAAMLSAEGVGGGELRGVTVVPEGSVTVFVEDNDEAAVGETATQ